MATRIGLHLFTKFVPDCDGSDELCRCKYKCNKHCLQYISHAAIVVARAHLKGGNPKKRAKSMKDYANVNLLKNGKRICTTCLTVVFACSRNKLYPPTSKAKTAAFLFRKPPSKVDISIMSWFEAQTFCLDCDPEDGTLTVPAAKKSHVYKWYAEDVAKYPCCYEEASKSYFNKTWLRYFPFVKCRKWLRFAKCPKCVKLRDVIADRENTKEERKRAQLELRTHYGAMKEERAYHRQYVLTHSLFLGSCVLLFRKTNEALQHPAVYLHIDWDGTSQLGNGFPHFKESTHDEDKAKQRIANHLNIVVVAGFRILVFDNLEFLYQGPDMTIELLQRTLKRVEKVSRTLSLLT